MAKSLWRDELVFAKWCLDCEIKHETLHQMLEWHFEIAHDWKVRPGVLGRRLKELLPGNLWSELLSTYVGPDTNDNWAALFGTTALFRQVAREVGNALGFTYPQNVDDQVSAYLNAIQQLPPPASVSLQQP